MAPSLQSMPRITVQCQEHMEHMLAACDASRFLCCSLFLIASRPALCVTTHPSKWIGLFAAVSRPSCRNGACSVVVCWCAVQVLQELSAALRQPQWTGSKCCCRCRRAAGCRYKKACGSCRQKVRPCQLQAAAWSFQSCACCTLSTWQLHLQHWQEEARSPRQLWCRSHILQRGWHGCL